VTRDEFPYVLEVQTRWADNDVYGHVNNVVYYSYFDTLINRYLIEQGGLDIALDHIIAVCVESQCSYKRSIAFPEVIQAGLRVTKLGNTSVHYEVGVFRGQDLCALGTFVHVFVARGTRKPTPIPPAIREGLTRLATSGGRA
jgi:acyl-CoA thioester hydrolase